MNRKKRNKYILPTKQYNSIYLLVYYKPKTFFNA